MDGGGTLIVADTNLIIAWACKTENSPLAFAVHAKDSDWIAPTIWQSEFRNALLGMMRAGKIGVMQANTAFQFAYDSVETFDVATSAVLRIAEANHLTAYDAEFAALAERMDCQAVAFDEHLWKSGLAVHPKNF